MRPPRRENTTQSGSWTPWRSIVAFGIVSLLADLVYEGARSVSGPLLSSLGASALLVGVVTGAGDAAALVLRLFFGTLADRTGGYWTLTIAGYGLTAVSVPLLAVTPFLGGAGLAVACALLLAERTGKAVRSPSKSALLAIAAAGVGRGRGFGVHKALDQIGAFAGPLLVAAVVTLTARIWPAMAVLAIPGIAAMVVLVLVRAHLNTTAQERPALPSTHGWFGQNIGRDLPATFFLFAAAAGATTAGLVSYGLIGFHLTDDAVVPVAGVPLIYALGMATAAVGALVTGWAYDRLGGARTLFILPVLVSAVPALVFSSALATVLAGVAIWGFAVGLQDSAVKAYVADLVPQARLAGAYGVFAAIQGAAAILGGTAAGYLYEQSLPLLVGLVVAVQVGAVVLLVVVRRRSITSDG